MKRLYSLVGACISAAIFAACGGAGTNPPSALPRIQPDRQARTGSPFFAYVTDIGSNTIYAYAVDGTTGALTPVQGSPFETGKLPWGITAADGKFVYVANGVGTNQYDHSPSHVSGYAIDTTDGVLTPLKGSPFKEPGHGAADMAVVGIAARKYAYVVNIYSDDISAYQINTVSGALTPVAGTPFGTGGEPESLTIDPKGKFAFVPNTLTDDVSAFKITRATGALVSVAGSPFSAGITPAGAAVDSTGSFLYVTNANSNNISAYIIHESTGVLTRVKGSPYKSDTPSRAAADPGAGFIYVSNNGSDTVSAYAVNPVTGALTTVNGSPFATAHGPSAVTVDPTGTFVYVGTTNGISAYKITTANGALTPVPGSPFAAGTSPAGIVVRR